jgi:large subunit ribosomal protein L25
MVEVSSTIQCKTRQTCGKEAAHKLRAAGLTPAVAYGPGREPILLSLDPKVFGLTRQSFGMSYIYDIDVEDGTSFKALIKEVQMDPLSRHLLHVDFYAVDMSKPIRVEVPIELVGKPVGVVEGGLLSQVLRRVEVQCLPDNVPAKLAVDVSHLDIGHSVHTDAIDLPEGVAVVAKRPEAIAIIVEPETDETPAAEAAVEGVEGEALAEGEAKPASAESEAKASGAEGDGGEEKKKKKE